jgi:hypothetical protein
MHIAGTGLKKASLTALAAVALIAGGQGLTAKEKPRASPPRVTALVQQIINAYGGRDVLKKVRSLSARGVLESPMYGGPAEYSLDLREDRKLRVEIRVGKSFELRILNGTRGYYRTDDSQIAEVSGTRFLSMVYQFKEITMPQQLMASSFTITDGGRETLNNSDVRLLLLTDAEGPPMKVYIDLKSRRIVKDSGIFTVEGAETELSSEFHDFRKVDGVLLPFQVVNYAGGERIGKIHITKYRVNPQLPDSLFLPDSAVGKEMDSR